MILLHGASSRTGSQPACSPQQHDECTWMGAILASSPRAEYFLMNHTANHYSWGKCTGPNEPFFFEDDSRRAVFTSPARHRRDRGASRETDSIFSTLKGRPAGHGARVRARARLATHGSPVDSPSAEASAEICLVSPSRKRPAGPPPKKLYYARFPFVEWDVSRGVTSAGMPQGKGINRHPAVLVV